jgi:hypothetical protein
LELEIRTKHDYWSTDDALTGQVPLAVASQGGSASSTALQVELSTLGYPMHDAVRRYLQRTGASPLASRHSSVDPASYGGVMDNAVAPPIAHRVRRELARLVAEQPFIEIHLFAAMPQALVMMIGQRLHALPPVRLYEYDGREYHPSHHLSPNSSLVS